MRNRPYGRALLIAILATLSGCASQYIDALVLHPNGEPARGIAIQVEAIRFADFTYSGIGSDRTDRRGLATVGIRSAAPISRIVIKYGPVEGWYALGNVLLTKVSTDEGPYQVQYPTEWIEIPISTVMIRSKNDPSVSLPPVDPGPEPKVWIRHRKRGIPYQPRP